MTNDRLIRVSIFRRRFLLITGLLLGCRPHPPAPGQHSGTDALPTAAAADPGNVVGSTPPVDSAVDTVAHARISDFLPDAIEIRSGDSTLDERTVAPSSDFVAANTPYLYFQIPFKLPVGATYGTDGHHHCEITRAESDEVLVFELRIQLSTTGVSLGGEYGLPVPGFWLPGHYRVSCAIDGRIIGSNFRVTGLPMRLDQNLVGHIAALGAAVTQVTFFENGGDGRTDRPTSRVFSAATSRYININVAFTLPGSAGYPPTPVRCTFHRDDGTQVGAYEVVLAPDPGSKSWVVFEGFGNKEPGWWRPGLYFAECRAGHERVAAAPFEVQQ